LGKPVRSISYKDTKSRWGSCTSEGNLSFSWRIAMAPDFVIDYLAAHEVAHLKEMNHGPDFWDYLPGTLPAHRRRQTLAQAERFAAEILPALHSRSIGSSVYMQSFERPSFALIGCADVDLSRRPGISTRLDADLCEVSRHDDTDQDLRPEHAGSGGSRSRSQRRYGGFHLFRQEPAPCRRLKRCPARSERARPRGVLKPLP
jgi:hypothetical protein